MRIFWKKVAESATASEALPPNPVGLWRLRTPPPDPALHLPPVVAVLYRVRF